VTEHILKLEQVTVAERLKDAGYATGFFGKWHLQAPRIRMMIPQTSGEKFYPDKQGFDNNIGGCSFTKN
jgi:arylsulfatase A